VGSAYVAVLAVTGMLVLMGLAGVAALRAQRATAWLHRDTQMARELAVSAAELVLEGMRANPRWRDERGGGVWIDERRVSEEATVSAGVRDDVDGDIGDDPEDAVRVVGVGHVNGARQSIGVTVDPVARGYRVFGSAIHAGGLLNINKDTVRADRALTANGSIEHDGVAYASGSKELAMRGGVTVTGSVVGHALPDFESGAELLAAIGTEIDYEDLDEGSIEDVVLSANNNPYGDENPYGIYVIDADGDELDVRDSVLFATLVVTNAGSDSEVEADVYWRSASDSLPALVHDGDMEFRMDAGTVTVSHLTGSEDISASVPALVSGVASTVDLSVAGVKIDIAVGPTDSSYESGLRGLFLVSGDVRVDRDLTLEGTLVAGGGVRLNADSVTVTEAADWVANPPLGFVGWYAMVARGGSWGRVVAE
jgi:hypothetical protein